MSKQKSFILSRSQLSRVDAFGDERWGIFLYIFSAYLEKKKNWKLREKFADVFNGKWLGICFNASVFKTQKVVCVIIISG